MAEISLRPGDALRIEQGKGLSLLLRAHGDGWEVRVINPWWKRWLRAWRESAQARLLAELDRHILRDIGMDLGSGDPLAAHAHALRQQEQRRIAMAQLGLL
jgi:hypothetical protein